MNGLAFADAMRSSARNACGFLLVALATSAARAADGDVDSSFGDHGFVLINTWFETPALNVQPRIAVVDSTGRVLVAATAQHINAAGDHVDTNFAAFRLTDAGEIDGTFAPDTNGFSLVNFGLNGIGPPGRDQVQAVAVQPDGKIVLAGCAYFNDVDSHFAVARLGTAGQLDATFGQHGSAHFGSAQSNCANAVAIDHTANIVLGGETTRLTVNGSQSFAAVARLTPSGAIDPAFNFGVPREFVFQDPAPPYNYTLALDIDSDNRIVSGGGFDSATTDGGAVLRLQANGANDPAWNNATPVVIDAAASAVRTIYPIAEGGWIVGGSAFVDGDSVIYLQKLQADGSLDTSFGNGGIVTFGIDQSTITLIAPTKRDGWLAAGPYREEGIFIAKVLRDGRPDSTLAGTGLTKIVYQPQTLISLSTPALLPDGRLVAAGYTAEAADNGVGDIGLMRVLADYDTIFVGDF